MCRLCFVLAAVLAWGVVRASEPSSSLAEVYAKTEKILASTEGVEINLFRRNSTRTGAEGAGRFQLEITSDTTHKAIGALKRLASEVPALRVESVAFSPKRTSRAKPASSIGKITGMIVLRGDPPDTTTVRLAEAVQSVAKPADVRFKRLSVKRYRPGWKIELHLDVNRSELIGETERAITAAVGRVCKSTSRGEFSSIKKRDGWWALAVSMVGGPDQAKKPFSKDASTEKTKKKAGKEVRWESLLNSYGGGLQRAKVPGGWLVCVTRHNGIGLTFYPDPKHVWDGSSPP